VTHAVNDSAPERVLVNTCLDYRGKASHGAVWGRALLSLDGRMLGTC